MPCAESITRPGRKCDLQITELKSTSKPAEQTSGASTKRAFFFFFFCDERDFRSRERSYRRAVIVQVVCVLHCSGVDCLDKLIYARAQRCIVETRSAWCAMTRVVIPARAPCFVSSCIVRIRWRAAVYRRSLVPLPRATRRFGSAEIIYIAAQLSRTFPPCCLYIGAQGGTTLIPTKTERSRIAPSNAGGN